jgi:hypothetical protein
MEKQFSLAKYGNKWSVYSHQSRTYNFIGCGKKFCTRKVNELNSILDTGKLIRIDGVDYKIVNSDIIEPFERMVAVKCGEAVRYYDKYLYRTIDGQIRACYANDTSNNFSV